MYFSVVWLLAVSPICCGSSEFIKFNNLSVTNVFSSGKRVSVQTGYIMEGLQEAVAELMLAVKVSPYVNEQDEISKLLTYRRHRKHCWILSRGKRTSISMIWWSNHTARIKMIVIYRHSVYWPRPVSKIISSFWASRIFTPRQPLPIYSAKFASKSKCTGPRAIPRSSLSNSSVYLQRGVSQSGW